MSAAPSAAGGAAQSANAPTPTPPAAQKTVQPTVKPTFSFAAAILKGNSTPAPVVAAVKPQVKKSATPAAAAAPIAATKDHGKSKKAPKAAAATQAEQKVIPLTAGSLWAKKLQIGDGPVKPLAAAVVPTVPATAPKPKEATPAAAPVSATTSSTSTPATTSSSSATATTPSVTSAPLASTSTVAAVAPSTPAVAAVSPAQVAPTPVAAAAPAETKSTPIPAAAERIQKKGTAEANKQQQQQQQPKAQPQPSKAKSTPTVATKSTAPAPLSVSSTTSAPAPVGPSSTSNASQSSTPKFGLVPVDQQSKKKSSAGTTFAGKRDDQHAPSMTSALPSNYQLYPLSPYQLFLLDPRTGGVSPSISALNTQTGHLEELSGAATDCVPLILVPAAIGGAGELHPLCELVANQLSYYFSADNLVRDVYLRKQMNERGYINLQQLLTFRRIHALTSSAYYLECAARYCVEVLSPEDLAENPEKALVEPGLLFKIKKGALRLRNGWKKYVFPRPSAATTTKSLKKATDVEEDGESSEEELVLLDDSFEAPNPAAAKGAPATSAGAVDASTLSTSAESSPMDSRAGSPTA